ncbi:unannotated protein [freshwater metagenome]|uniref:Unannotated protein n=1 Tax=freshwater metagenome TaxID=449393 RepID=A0A6J7EZR0_9ZZZZ
MSRGPIQASMPSRCAYVRRTRARRRTEVMIESITASVNSDRRGRGTITVRMRLTVTEKNRMIPTASRKPREARSALTFTDAPCCSLRPPTS